MKPKLRWKRILLKLTGETLGGKGNFGLNVSAAQYIAREIKKAHKLGCQIALVVGGGNFIRGEKLSALGIDRTTADYMGMLGTSINGLALQSTLEKEGLETRLMSPLKMIEVAEPFIRRRALHHLERGRIVIFAGGTGNPYFSTDTAAVLRASEIGAEVVFKASNVEGVYESDPRINKKAKLIKTITAHKAVQKKLRVMDLTAITLAMENNMPITIFNVFKEGNLERVIQGEKIGSEII